VSDKRWPPDDYSQPVVHAKIKLGGLTHTPPPIGLSSFDGRFDCGRLPYWKRTVSTAYSSDVEVRYHLLRMRGWLPAC
jgi:hypothetical protein